MPIAKINKALQRVERMAQRRDVSRHDLECLLGSLRHVCICLPSAIPFHQRLHTSYKCAPRRGRIPVSDSLRLALAWLRSILMRGDWRGLPTQLFWTEPVPDVHVYMDASNQGLAVLDPARERYIQARFDEDECRLIDSSSGESGLSINVRELFCVTLAAVVWGSDWTPSSVCAFTTVRAWSANTSTVAWSESLRSDDPLAQELLRPIELCEATSRFRISSYHLPGAANYAADAGSRAWSDPFRRRWTIFSRVWTQRPVSPSARYLYKTFSQGYSPMHWPARAIGSTSRRGGSGASGAPAAVPRSGLAVTEKWILPSSSRLYSMLATLR